MSPAFSSIGEFVAMNGYALYVWGSFAMCVAAFVWEAVLLAQHRRRALQAVHDDAEASGTAR